MLLNFVILPAFFIVCNVFPALHIIKGAIRDKSNTIWVLWFVLYYCCYNSLVAPIAIHVSSFLGMRKLYYLAATVGIGALTNPMQPMLTKVVKPLWVKILGVWAPAEKIGGHLWSIADILCEPANLVVKKSLIILKENIPGWDQSVQPVLDQVLDLVDAAHRDDAPSSPKATLRKKTEDFKEALKEEKEDDKAK